MIKVAIIGLAISPATGNIIKNKNKGIMMTRRSVSLLGRLSFILFSLYYRGDAFVKAPPHPRKTFD